VEAIDPAERVRFVSAALHADASNARWWNLAWVSVSLGATGTNTVLAAYANDWGHRAYNLEGALNGLITPALVLLQPLRAPFDAEAVDRLRVRMDGCDAVAQAERLLQLVAQDEQSRVSWLKIGVPLAANVALLAGIGLAVGDWQNGAPLLIGETVVIAGQLWTTPQGARRALEQYRSGQLGAQRTTGLPQVVPFCTAIACGAALAGTF
jgi:hypothetical protein